jgi:hypothetical protein
MPARRLWRLMPPTHGTRCVHAIEPNRCSSCAMTDVLCCLVKYRCITYASVKTMKLLSQKRAPLLRKIDNFSAAGANGCADAAWGRGKVEGGALWQQGAVTTFSHASRAPKAETHAVQVQADVLALHGIAAKLREARFGSGALRLDNTKLDFTLDADGNPDNAHPHGEPLS